MKNKQIIMLRYLLQRTFVEVNYQDENKIKKEALFAMQKFNGKFDKLDSHTHNLVTGMVNNNKDFFSELYGIGRSGVCGYHPHVPKIPCLPNMRKFLRKISLLNFLVSKNGSGLQWYHIKQELEVPAIKKVVDKWLVKNLYDSFIDNFKEKIIENLSNKEVTNDNKDILFKDLYEKMLEIKHVNKNDYGSDNTKKQKTSKIKLTGIGNVSNKNNKDDNKNKNGNSKIIEVKTNKDLNDKQIEYFCNTKFNDPRIRSAIERKIKEMIYVKDKHGKTTDKYNFDVKNYLSIAFEAYIMAMYEFLEKPIRDNLQGEADYLLGSKSEAYKKFLGNFKLELSNNLEKFYSNDKVKSKNNLKDTDTPLDHININDSGVLRIDEASPLLNKSSQLQLQQIFQQIYKEIIFAGKNVNNSRIIIKQNNIFLDPIKTRTEKKCCSKKVVVKGAIKSVGGANKIFWASSFAGAKGISNGLLATWGAIQSGNYIFIVNASVSGFIVCFISRGEKIFKGTYANIGKMETGCINVILKTKLHKISKMSLGELLRDPVCLLTDKSIRWLIWALVMVVGTTTAGMSPFFTIRSCLKGWLHLDDKLAEQLTWVFTPIVVVANCFSFIFFNAENLWKNIDRLIDTAKTFVSSAVDLLGVRKLTAMLTSGIFVGFPAAFYYYIQLQKGINTICNELVSKKNMTANITAFNILRLSNVTGNITRFDCDILAGTIADYSYPLLYLMLLVTQIPKVYDLIKGGGNNPWNVFRKITGKLWWIALVLSAYFSIFDPAQYAYNGYLGTKKFFEEIDIEFGADVAPIVVFGCLFTLSFVFTHMGAVWPNMGRLIYWLGESGIGSLNKLIKLSNSCCGTKFNLLDIKKLTSCCDKWKSLEANENIYLVKQIVQVLQNTTVTNVAKIPVSQLENRVVSLFNLIRSGSMKNNPEMQKLIENHLLICMQTLKQKDFTPKETIYSMLFENEAHEFAKSFNNNKIVQLLENQDSYFDMLINRAKPIETMRGQHKLVMLQEMLFNIVTRYTDSKNNETQKLYKELLRFKIIHLYAVVLRGKLGKDSEMRKKYNDKVDSLLQDIDKTRGDKIESRESTLSSIPKREQNSELTLKLKMMRNSNDLIKDAKQLNEDLKNENLNIKNKQPSQPPLTSGKQSFFLTKKTKIDKEEEAITINKQIMIKESF